MLGPQDEARMQVESFFHMVTEVLIGESLKIQPRNILELKQLSTLLTSALKNQDLNLDAVRGFIDNNFGDNPGLKNMLSNALEPAEANLLRAQGGEAPRTFYPSSEAEMISDWINKIDNYEISPDRGRIGSLLTKSKARDKLYADTNPEQTKVARTAFLFGLYDTLQQPSKVQPQSKTTITMEALLEPKGVELYKAAILEENQSRQFRDAVFLSSTQHYDGPTWDKNLILWVGGPSASGKTYGASAAVKKVGQHMDATSGINAGNNVVSIDGAVEREVSQIRQLVLQVALSKGYKGIKDLHKNTELAIEGHDKVKDRVKNAALAQENLSLVIPETFAESYFQSFNPLNVFKSAEEDPSLKKGEMIQYDRMQRHGKAVQAFAEVKCVPGKEKSFQTAVFHMGTSRAWLDKDFKRSDISINNRDIGCESKVYGKDGFKWGVKGSAKAREQLGEINPNLIYLEIKSDLIFVKKNQKGAWEEWTALEEAAPNNAPTFKLSNRDFKEWREKEAIKGKDALDLPDWYRERSKAKELAKPDITVLFQGKELPDKPVIISLEENKSELRDKDEQDEELGMNQSQQPTISLTEEEGKLKEKMSKEEEAVFERERLMKKNLEQSEDRDFLEDEFDENFGRSPFQLEPLPNEEDDDEVDMAAAIKASLEEQHSGFAVPLIKEKSKLEQGEKKNETSDDEQLYAADDEELYYDDESSHDEEYDEQTAMEAAIKASLEDRQPNSSDEEKVDIDQLLTPHPTYIPSHSPEEKKGERQTLRSAVLDQGEQDASPNPGANVTSSTSDTKKGPG